MTNASFAAQAGRVALARREAAAIAAIFERMFPAAPDRPGACALGVVDYLDRALDGTDREALDLYRRMLPLLDRAAHARAGADLAGCPAASQDELIAALERGALPGIDEAQQVAFFARLRRHLIEGLFADPAHGGNRAAGGWAALGHPGVWTEHAPADHLAGAPVDHGGRIRTLADHERDLPAAIDAPRQIPGFDPDRGTLPPTGDADVVIVGAGGVGGLAAAWLALAGLRVVALEAGPWREAGEFKPDELGLAFYARAGMSGKFMLEAPRWRESDASDDSEPMTFSLGRMVNGVGGSLIHYGARLRRLHPHQFRMLSTIRALGLDKRLDPDCTIADWPLDYDDLEPHYEALEREIGIAGPDTHPFIPRRNALPMPAMRPFAAGEAFAAMARARGLHPVQVPVGQNTVPYDGRPATSYSPWAEGLGSASADRWAPTQDLLPRALASGNLDLRTRCRVLRVLAGTDGRARGVAYVDAAGRLHEQAAPIVVLAGYSFENVRLLMLSGDGKHQGGLGNDSSQVGQHFMTKQFPSVVGDFPGRAFNRHTGPGAQGIIVEDYLRPERWHELGPVAGGNTFGTENQLLPIQIALEPLLPGAPSWGERWIDHLRAWNQRLTLRIQTDTLPYRSNRLDLDPLHRDRTGYGLPVVRITYRLRDNERKMLEGAVALATGFQRDMGAARIWPGPLMTGIGSCHDHGGVRMGDDPACAVVDRDLQVHDTPGLYVFGGAVFPSCPGVNPTLTIWALARRACEAIVAAARRR